MRHLNRQQGMFLDRGPGMFDNHDVVAIDLILFGSQGQCEDSK